MRKSTERKPLANAQTALLYAFPDFDGLQHFSASYRVAEPAHQLREISALPLGSGVFWPGQGSEQRSGNPDLVNIVPGE
jgi:hypothetical protein